MLCLFAMLSGAMCAWLREAGCGLTWMFADFVNKRLKRGLALDCDSESKSEESQETENSG